MGKKAGKKGFYRSVKVNWRTLGAALLSTAVIFAAIYTVSAAMPKEAVQLPVVMYHSVLKDESRHGKYVISPAELENDLLYLREHGYETILISDLIAYTKGGKLPEKPILLTFDDGYYNNYLYAFELAKQYKSKFVISPIGFYSDQYTETPDENAYYSHCTWPELREMADSGLVEIQNHSYNLHKTKGRLGVKKRSGESDAQYEAMLKEDLLHAQDRIGAEVGKTPAAFVYPFGAMSKTTPEIVRGLGFSATLTCEERVSSVSRDPESLFGIGRFLRVSGVSSQSFFEKLGVK